jgi:hypothetical protein
MARLLQGGTFGTPAVPTLAHGNMAQAMISAILDSGLCAPESIMASDIDEEKLPVKPEVAGICELFCLLQDILQLGRRAGSRDEGGEGQQQ